MFRWSLRELMALVVAAAMSIAWYAEHQQVVAAMDRQKALQDTATERQAALQKELNEWQSMASYREKQINDIDRDLAEHGLQVSYLCGFIGTITTVTKRYQDEEPEIQQSDGSSGR